jgi:hexulose-6-phosphate isomerase
MPADAPPPDPRRASPRRYDMKKSINLWAFPYPQRMTLGECLRLAKNAGFDAVELNYDLDNDLSPRAGPGKLGAIRQMAADMGIAISGLCSFLYWPYALTSNDSARRTRGLELAHQMIEAAHQLGTPNLLVVPGAVHIPWFKDHDPVPYHVCDQRAREAITQLLPHAERLGVSLNIENIFFNGYLLSPDDLIRFVDSFQSKYVKVHFDTGNIMLCQYPEDWIPLLGQRIQNVHLKEFSKNSTDHYLLKPRPLAVDPKSFGAIRRAVLLGQGSCLLQGRPPGVRRTRPQAADRPWAAGPQPRRRLRGVGNR